MDLSLERDTSFKNGLQGTEINAVGNEGMYDLGVRRRIE